MSHRAQQLIAESRRGHVDRIKRLLNDGADVNCRGKYGYTPLMESASHGHFAAVECLLDSGADPKICADDNAPVTFYACVRGYADVVDLLLRSGVDPNAVRDSDCKEMLTDTRGVSQLHIALRSGFDTIALSLINAGANIDHVTHGKTPLDVAIEQGMTNVAHQIREVDLGRSRSRQNGLAEQGGGGQAAIRSESK